MAVPVLSVITHVYSAQGGGDQQFGSWRMLPAPICDKVESTVIDDPQIKAIQRLDFSKARNTGSYSLVDTVDPQEGTTGFESYTHVTLDRFVKSEKNSRSKVDVEGIEASVFQGELRTIIDSKFPPVTLNRGE